MSLDSSDPDVTIGSASTICIAISDNDSKCINFLLNLFYLKVLFGFPCFSYFHICRCNSWI